MIFAIQLENLLSLQVVIEKIRGTHNGMENR